MAHVLLRHPASDLRRIAPASRAVLERVATPSGVGVSGLESDGADLFYCGRWVEREDACGAADGRAQAVQSANT